MTVAYAEVGDIYDLGLTAQAFVVLPRPFDPRKGDSLDFATGTFSLSGHGLVADDLAWLVLIASGGSIPTGGSTTVTYHPLPLNYRQFRLSLTVGGSAVTFADAGTPTGGTTAWGIQTDPERRLARRILQASAEIDQDLTAHETPLQRDITTGKYPEKVIGIVARMVAREATAGLIFENPAYKVAKERVFAQEARDDKQREDWRNGQPIYPNPRDQNDVPDNAVLATNSVVRGEVCSMPWLTGVM